MYNTNTVLTRTPQADLEGRATYLESSAANNLPYYIKYGFEHITDIELKRGAEPIKLHIMVREPQSMAESSKGVAKIRAV